MWLQVASQNKCRRAATPLILIVGFATADVAESGAGIKLAGRNVALVNFQEHSVHTDTCKSPQMQIEQAAR
jgi:hypothetical protein